MEEREEGGGGRRRHLCSLRFLPSLRCFFNRALGELQTHPELKAAPEACICLFLLKRKEKRRHEVGFRAHTSFPFSLLAFFVLTLRCFAPLTGQLHIRLPAHHSLVDSQLVWAELDEVRSCTFPLPRLRLSVLRMRRS